MPLTLYSTSKERSYPLLILLIVDVHVKSIKEDGVLAWRRTSGYYRQSGVLSKLSPQFIGSNKIQIIIDRGANSL